MADTYGDPGAKITDPTGGAPNFNIADVFKQFGYYPTQDEINAIAPSFEGRYNIQAIGTSAVSQYVLQKKAEIDRQKNDPLAALQKKMDDSVALMKNQVQGLYGQLQDTLSAAPQLFGNMTPDQIGTYLAPLKSAFTEQLGQIQGVMASRGLAASSTENNALAQTGEKFQENVMSTGLQVGLDAQKNKAASIQAQINNLFGLTGTEEGIAGSAAGQRSSQNLGQSNLIASLPFFLNQASQQQDLIARQLNSQGGFQGKFDQVTGDISKGMNALQTLAMVPSQFKTATPGGTPYTPASTPSGSPFGLSQPNPNTAFMSDQAALFAAA
jgi:hypothetical protein